MFVGVCRALVDGRYLRLLVNVISLYIREAIYCAWIEFRKHRNNRVNTVTNLLWLESIGRVDVAERILPHCPHTVPWWFG